MSQHELETEIELGERALFCTILIEYDYEKPEKPDFRERGYSRGYPGSDEQVAPWHVQVTTADVGGETLDRNELAKIGKGSWLRWLDAHVYYLIEDDCKGRGTFYDDMASNAVGEEY